MSKVVWFVLGAIWIAILIAYSASAERVEFYTPICEPAGSKCEPVARYHVELSKNGGSYRYVGLVHTGRDPRRLTIYLSNNRANAYRARVKAIDKDGNVLVTSAPSAVYRPR